MHSHTSPLYCPLPAVVLACPAGESESTTYKLPAPSNSIPSGALKRALVPRPSELPDSPDTPAMVVTVPSGVIAWRV
jgi:uncharacterized lipoprotein YmbA